MHTTLPDGSEFIEPIPCDRCGALAYLVLSIPYPKKPSSKSEYSNALLALIAFFHVAVVDFRNLFGLNSDALSTLSLT
jgi:hypothetical protein